jgi:putative ABC transport system substrate-binding protein
MTRIGVFMNLPKGDAEAEARIRGLRQGLENLGHNDLEIECRYGAGTEDICRKNAKELVDLNPAVIHAASGVMLDALQQEMHRAGRTIPIVFAGVIDPVGTRKIASLEKPGGNATGCASILFNIGAKWLALLKFAAPGLTRAAVIRDGTTLAGRGQFNAVAGAAKTLGVRLNPVDVSNASEIEQAITVELYRSAAGYIDRIVKHHAKPAELPVQQTAKYELDINLRTARAIGLSVPPALLIFADRVIE